MKHLFEETLSPIKQSSETRDIFVRAHTTTTKKATRLSSALKWPGEVLVIDTETTTDTAQRLTFGCYWLCTSEATGYRCSEEGLFHADDQDDTARGALEAYVDNPLNSPATEVKTFPPQMRLKLFSRSEFVERIFWKAIRRGAMVVGFNLPFDLSRLAVKACGADDGGWSLVLSLRKSRKTGEMESNPERPRVVITSLDSKMAFISLRSIFRPDEWPNEPRFLDLHTLGRALRDESCDLKQMCKNFNCDGKMDYTPTGQISSEEIEYCRQDVRATAALLNAMRREFDQHPIKLRPDRAYSPASIAKAYLSAMNIAPPKTKFDVPDKDLGIAMQSYYGGRAEIRIRKIPVPVVHTDFTSQYPTVNALLGNSDVLNAESVTFDNCTEQVQELLANVTHQATLEAAFWKQLSFFALIQADNDVVPVRTLYNGRTQNIGLNHLTSEESVWFAGPDAVAATLHSGKPPRVLKAIRMVPHGQQPGLKSTNLAGMVAINPKSDDFFRYVIEQKTVHKSTNKPLSHFLKILANSGSYGLFVEVNQEKSSKPVKVGVFSGEKISEGNYCITEKSGRWYFPPLASLITAGGRLLLAILERCVIDAGGTYLFCDTDSLCIVSSEYGGLVPCPGGNHNTDDGHEAVKAITWQQVEEIKNRLNSLNPYNRPLVPDLLKIEDVNFVDSDRSKLRRQIFGYAVSAKRYALFTRNEDSISIVKASGHGLGYLYSPKTGFNKEAGAPEWIVEAWDWLLRSEFGLLCQEPAWLDLPAMMRMALTSPRVMQANRPDWLSPYSFFLLPLLSELDGYPAGFDRSTFRFITRFESDREKWRDLEGVNIFDGQTYRMESFPNGKQNKVVAESLRLMLRLYLRRPEWKSLSPDGKPCEAQTRGLLKRASISAKEIIPVSKETDRHWEQGEDLSMIDFAVLEYRQPGNLVSPDANLQTQIVMTGLREMMRRTGLSQHTIESVRRGQRVRSRTVAILKQALTVRESC